MIKLHQGGVTILNGRELAEGNAPLTPEEARKNTIAYGILSSHNTSGNDGKLRMKFDAMASHDITYVGIIQTARAGGLKEFPLPYVLTNCHNSLCAVGGTINEDDHRFGLSAAQKYGGIFVPAHQAVIHSYMRETMAGCGKMILGSDSHTRYGALGTLAIGEGGPELVKQLLGLTYDIDLPEVIACRLTGSPRPGVGPQDVALAIIGAVFACEYVKNKVIEFIGDGIANLPMEFRNGIDVMTTESACLSSIWMTDNATEEYFVKHHRPEAYKKLAPGAVAYYDGLIDVDLSAIEPMIALPYHPSNVYTIRELKENAHDLLAPLGLAGKIGADGRIRVDQGVIAGCAGGTYDNLCAAADILAGQSIGCGEFALSAYPASQPVFTALMRSGRAEALLDAGVTLRSAFCGPCFGAGDVPANGGLSIRHSTRNFPNREGSKPGAGQSACVALMDARSIAATAANGGILTAADELDVEYSEPNYVFDDSAYRARVYNYSSVHAEPDTELVYGPNIKDWPEMKPLADVVVMRVASVIDDPVTTTDELIPSGETSSYRSNPLKLAEFTLSRKDPAYVGRAKAACAPYEALPEAMRAAIDVLLTPGASVGTGSVIYAVKPGDGSAREQAASCQRVLGGLANIAHEYATKRYRSNLINWGMLPCLLDEPVDFSVGDAIVITGARDAVEANDGCLTAYAVTEQGAIRPLPLRMGKLTEDEKKIILAGCLVNYYKTLRSR